MLHALELTTYRARLNALQARLDANATQFREELSHGSGESATGLSTTPADPGDRASAQSEIDVNIALAENEAHLRTEIDAALQRITDGTFGICQKCGMAIRAQRLHAVPYARYCIRCERRIEQQTTS